jgi:hypothetical protein
MKYKRRSQGASAEGSPQVSRIIATSNSGDARGREQPGRHRTTQSGGNRHRPIAFVADIVGATWKTKGVLGVVLNTKPFGEGVYAGLWLAVLGVGDGSQRVAARCQGGCCKSIKAWLNAFGHDRSSPGKPRLKAGASSPPRVRHPRRVCHPMPTRRAQP